jgi:hypothetical protein
MPLTIPVTIPVVIERRSKSIGALSKCFIFIDGQEIGTVSNGRTIETAVPLGRHFISAATAPEDSLNNGCAFDATEDHVCIFITVAAKTDRAGLSGSFVVMDVEYT